MFVKDVGDDTSVIRLLRQQRAASRAIFGSLTYPASRGDRQSRDLLSRPAAERHGGRAAEAQRQRDRRVAVPGTCLRLLRLGRLGR